MTPARRGGRRRTPALPALVTVLAASGAAADPVGAQVDVGDRVRLRPGPWAAADFRAGGPEWIEGDVALLTADTLFLRVGATVLRVPVRPPPEVQLRELVRDHAARGALIGAALGLGVGAVLVHEDDRDFPRTGNELLHDDQIAVLVLSALAGGTVGGLLGWSVRDYRWVSVRLSPGARGVGAAGPPVALSLRLLVSGVPGSGSARPAVHGRRTGVRPGPPSSR